MTTEERQNKNLYTLDELKSRGNHLIGFKGHYQMTMKRGETYTKYIKVNEYWTPIEANTK